MKYPWNTYEIPMKDQIFRWMNGWTSIFYRDVNTSTGIPHWLLSAAQPGKIRTWDSWGNVSGAICLAKSSVSVKIWEVFVRVIWFKNFKMSCRWMFCVCFSENPWSRTGKDVFMNPLKLLLVLGNLFTVLLPNIARNPISVRSPLISIGNMSI